MKLRQMVCLVLPGLLAVTAASCSDPPMSTPTPWPAATAVPASPTKAPPVPTATRVSPTETVASSGQWQLGESWQGRPIVAYWFGSGEHKVVAIGNIHGGTEENTHRLALELIGYFETRVEDIPSSVTLWVIPTANPDGLANDTRCNNRMVDLNRNADTDGDSCTANDWVSDTHTSEGLIEGGGGPYPFSEVETRLLRDFLGDAEVAIFYHSMAGEIFVTSCADHGPSARLAVVLSEATGYAFSQDGWASYPVTGAMVDYLAQQGVAGVEVELTNKTDTEFGKNLAGLEAVMLSVDRILHSG
jgi:hypothetical protein